jgi:hypothetical protein
VVLVTRPVIVAFSWTGANANLLANPAVGIAVVGVLVESALLLVPYCK